MWVRQTLIVEESSPQRERRQQKHQNAVVGEVGEAPDKQIFLKTKGKITKPKDREPVTNSMKLGKHTMKEGALPLY